MKNLLFKILTYPRPLRLAVARRIIRKFSLLSYESQLTLGLIERSHYGYCVFQAAKLAHLLNIPRISVIEFGCGGGNGLLNAEMHIEAVMKIFAVEIELYGFDMGAGLPYPKDYRDAPHFFRAGVFEMDRRSLEGKLKRAKLVIGDVKDTCLTFFERYNPAPIGAILWDLDFYSSTTDAMAIFGANSLYFLPRVFMYFDDIVGDDIWLCNEYTGEMLAIEEFNKRHCAKKIVRNQNTRLRYTMPLEYVNDTWVIQMPWPNMIYIYHDFEHPKYNEFIANEEISGLQKYIKLK